MTTTRRSSRCTPREQHAGRGVGRAMVTHLLGIARERGLARVSLETGSMSAFAPARTLYTSAGFTACPPFADYAPSPNSTFMTLALTATPANRTAAERSPTVRANGVE
ncbi:GNAT family N-acetyltransferase [Saccharopolyspora cebuensis]|uniref:GNAT family N-acetyltransferase n=1 Tax=Saccharopolyspora cebuensis TaxID=418759 RepID=A0ABV4CEA8_9PSEU